MSELLCTLDVSSINESSVFCQLGMQQRALCVRTEATQSAVLIYNREPAGRTVGAEVVERRVQLLHERDEEHRVSDGQPPLSHALRRARLRDAPRRLAH